MENAIEPVMVVKVNEAEMDEMWSFVKSKQQQRIAYGIQERLWSAIDHYTGKMLANVLAPHQNIVLVKLKALLQPLWSNSLLHRRMGSLSAIARFSTAHRWQGKCSEDRTSASDFENSD